MSKFGTGAAEAIWKWWSDLHRETFAEANDGWKQPGRSGMLFMPDIPKL